MQDPQSDVYLASGLENSRPLALKCNLWSTRRAQPLAELSQAERSEAQPREARPPPKAAGAVRRPGAEGDPRASRGPPSKARMRINCRDQAAAYKLPWSAGKRALHERDLKGALATNMFAPKGATYSHECINANGGKPSTRLPPGELVEQV